MRWVQPREARCRPTDGAAAANSIPNWAGVEQRRFIRSVSADELTFGNEGGSQGGTNEVTFKRIK
jgi:hypothetical protein